MELENERKNLIERLDNVISEVTMKEKGLSIFIIASKAINSKVDELINNAIDLQSQILNITNAIEMSNCKKKVIEYERIGHKLKMRLGIIPTFMVAYLGFGAITWITLQFNIPKFIVEKLGVEAPEKLISLGIAGAFLYLATEYISKQENYNENPKISIFLVRLSLSIIVPIVLVILFFDKKGNIKEMSISPELLSFCCGYSAKLVIGLFNKMIEKGSKMIDTI